MRTVSALLVAACSAVILGIALASAFGGLSPLAAALALAGGLGLGAVAWRQIRPGAAAPIGAVEWALIAVFAMACARAFLWLLYVKDFEYHVLSPNNMGDLPLHLDFIRYLASGVRFWPGTPIFVGEPLTYPIGADFFNSLLLAVGVPVERGLTWAGLGGSLLAGVALWRWGRGFALAAFLFGGGLTGFALLTDPAAAWRGPLSDYQAAQTWKNLFLALFVTQRGFLLALPAGLFLLDHWRSRYLRAERPLLPDWAALLLYASLPLFSVHAFLYLSLALAGMFLFATDAAARRHAARFGAVAVLPATLCAGLVTGWFSAGGVHWLPGWLQQSEPGVSAWWFWLRNFGLYLVLAAGLTIVVLCKGPREARAILLPAAVVFLACCFVSFAPWPWDNTKLLLWCWLAVAPCLWDLVLRPLPFPPRAALCGVLFFTGALSLFAGLDRRHDYELVDLIPLQQTADLVRTIPPAARFAAGSAQAYLHPLLILGRKLARGYPGHLMSHGITYEGRNRDKERLYEDLMLGTPRWQKSARALEVDYLYWGPLEEEEFPGSLKPWEQTLPVVGKGDDFVIYRLPAR